jgi:hypothetical protein
VTGATTSGELGGGAVVFVGVVVAVGDGGPEEVGAVGDVDGLLVAPVWWTTARETATSAVSAPTAATVRRGVVWPSGDVVWQRPWARRGEPWRVLAVPGGRGSTQYVAAHAGDDVTQPFEVRPAGGDRPLVPGPAVGAVDQRQCDQDAGHDAQDEDGHPRYLGVLGPLGHAPGDSGGVGVR